MELSVFAYLAVAAPVLGVALYAVVSVVLSRFDDQNVRRVAEELRASFARQALPFAGVVEIAHAPASPLVVRLRERDAPHASPVVAVRCSTTRFSATLARDGMLSRELVKTPESFDAESARAFVEEMLDLALSLHADAGAHSVSSGGSSIAVPG